MFKDIYDTYYVHLCVYANKLVRDNAIAEDIVQETISALWSKKVEIKVDLLKSYLYKAVYNKCLNHINHENIKKRYTQDVINEIHLIEVNTRTAEIEEEIFKEINKLIDTLPDKTKDIIKLKYVEGHKYSEISEKLNISQRSVGMHLSSGMTYLRDKIIKRIGVLLPIFLCYLYIINGFGF